MIVIIDNLKPAIDEANRYSPRINRQFLEYAQYRGFIVDPAYSGHAKGKGRIERLFETFQDRLVKELRLAGIDNINDADAFLEGYLPLHNKKFSFPSLSGIDMHRKPHANIKSALCIKNKRVLRNDNTISYCKNLYQVLDSTVAKKVDIEESLDGNIYFR